MNILKNRFYYVRMSLDTKERYYRCLLTRVWYKDVTVGKSAMNRQRFIYVSCVLVDTPLPIKANGMRCYIYVPLERFHYKDVGLIVQLTFRQEQEDLREVGHGYSTS